jgi:acylphosphatase
MTAREVFYEGRVQGVGFRYTCKQIARGYDVSGTVRNLPDGRVELICAGDPEEVEAFLEGIATSELKSHITEQTVRTIAPPEGLRGFQIVI